MSITRADIRTDVLLQFRRADKDDEIYQAVQYVCDDIARKFDDEGGYTGLKDATSELPLTGSIAYVDVSTALTNMMGRQIKKIVIIDSSNEDNNRTMDKRDELDFLEDYLELIEDPTDPQTEDLDIPSKYAPYGDNIYFWKIPDSDNYSAVIYFGKVHPTVSDTVDIIFPTDFKECIVNGVLARLYKYVEKKDNFSTEHYSLYVDQRNELIRVHSRRPNRLGNMKCLNH